MSLIPLGKDESQHNISIDLSTLLRTRMFISASSGGGKSETVRYLAEELCGQVQVIILDWEGEFSPLREKFPFVLVGEGGETPAHPKTAAQVALTLLKTRASAICDLYELKGNGRHEFVANFVTAMVEAPKELWHPVIIFIDEAHYVAPENGYGESVAKNAVIDLCNLGRKRGFCPILVSQRASKVSKNATEPLQNLCIGLTMPDDQKRICDVFKVAPGAMTREFSSALENLQPGEFFVRGAAISQLPVKIRFNRAQTHPPKTGSSAAAKRIPTPDSIKHLLPTLADIPVEAEKKAQTERELRNEIAQLKHTIRGLQLNAASANSISPERERMLLQQIDGLKKSATAYEKFFTSVDTTAAKIADSMSDLRKQIAALRDGNPQVSLEISSSLSVPSPQRAIETRVAPKNPASIAEGLTGPEQRIIDSIAWFEAIGVTEPEQPAVAFMANYTYGSGGYNNPRGRLNQRGFVTYFAGDKIALTDAGRAVANHPSLPPTNEALHQAILAKLEGPMVRILTPLLKAYPKGIDNESLANAAGYAPGSGGYNNPRGRLKSLGLVEYRDGKVYARDILFPEGAR